MRRLFAIMLVVLLAISIVGVLQTVGQARPNLTQCVDGIDNDGDQLIDSPADPGCANRLDNTEDDRPPTPSPSPTDVAAGAA